MASRIKRELALEVTGKDVSATRTLKGVDKGISSLERHAGKATRNIGRNIERGVVIGATAAAGAIGYSIKTAMDFESAIAGVAKVVDGDISGIVKGLKDMSGRLPTTFEDLAAIAEAGGALGIAKKDLLSFTETVALLGTTTDLTTEAAATSLGKLRTTLGLSGADFKRFGDILVHLGNNGASTESEILSMAESIAGAANIMGASKEQVLGWASALANTGEEAEAGGSSIQRFWLESFKSVQKGGADLKLMAKISGTSAKAFKSAFGRDSTGTLAKFLTKLGKLSKAEQVATLEALGFKDIRITRALLKLLGNTDNLTDSLHQAQQAGGAMGKEAEKRFKTTAAQVEIFKNNVRLAAATIGTELLPQLIDLAKEGTDWLQGHQPEIQQFAKDLAGGIRDAVTWARSLDWNAIAGALKAGAGGAQAIVDAFMAAPPWVQQLVVGGFAVNKITGGVIGDIAGDMLGGAFKQLFARGSSPANPLWVQQVGLPGGVGGAGGKGGLQLGGSGTVASRLLRVLGGLSLAIGGSALLGEGAKRGDTLGAVAGATGAGGMILGGAAIAGPLGAIAGSLAAIGQTMIEVNSNSSETATAVHDQTSAFIASKPTPDALRLALSGVEQGIADIRSNPLNVLVQGDALTQLEAMRTQLQGALPHAAPPGHDAGTRPTSPTGGGSAPPGHDASTRALGDLKVTVDSKVGQTTAAVGVMKDVLDSEMRVGTASTVTATSEVRDRVAAAESAVTTGANKTAAAARATESAARVAGYMASGASLTAAQQIIAAIWAARPIVNVSPTTIQRITTVQERTGETRSSANKDAIT